MIILFSIGLGKFCVEKSVCIGKVLVNHFKLNCAPKIRNKLSSYFKSCKKKVRSLFSFETIFTSLFHRHWQCKTQIRVWSGCVVGFPVSVAMLCFAHHNIFTHRWWIIYTESTQIYDDKVLTISHKTTLCTAHRIARCLLSMLLFKHNFLGYLLVQVHSVYGRESKKKAKIHSTKNIDPDRLVYVYI